MSSPTLIQDTEGAWAPDRPLLCPVCGGENPADAVFCGTPACGKALGEFRYVLEEVAAATSRIERLADAVTRFTGQPHFVTVHVVWLTLWILINSGLIVAFGVFDVHPYSLLGLVLAIEAILITGFLLISQNRQNVYAEKRAALDYEVNVRSFRKICELQESLAQVLQRLSALKRPPEGDR